MPAQVIPLAALAGGRLDPRVGGVNVDALAASRSIIVNIDYPIGVAAYNILREIAVDSGAGLRGVYVLGKAATLNADVGDVMISSVVHNEHSNSTYWLDNAFSVDDLAADLRFGTGLDNQRAVTVKSTFSQNRAYLDFYYREAFTVVEMEAGPYCDAVYEIVDPERHPSARPSTSQSCRSTSGSSTTPLTRRTRRRGRSAPAASATSGWTRHTRPRSRSSAGSCGSRERCRRRRTSAFASAGDRERA